MKPGEDTTQASETGSNQDPATQTKAAEGSKGAKSGESKSTDAKLAKENESLKKQLASLTKKLNDSETEKKHSAPVITHTDGKQYKVNVPQFRLGDETYTAADLKENSEVVDELLEMKSHILEEIKPTKASK